VEAAIMGLDAARRDEHLLEHLHRFDDWMQLSLIKLTDEIGQAFFGYVKEAEAMSQSQSQTLPDALPDFPAKASPRIV
jgi:hypothetical protein